MAIFYGTDLDDDIDGTDFYDDIFGYDPDDVLYGWDGDDNIYGGYDQDTISGGVGWDDLYGASALTICQAARATIYFRGALVVTPSAAALEKISSSFLEVHPVSQAVPPIQSVTGTVPMTRST